MGTDIHLLWWAPILIWTGFLSTDTHFVVWALIHILLTNAGYSFVNMCTVTHCSLLWRSCPFNCVLMGRCSEFLFLKIVLWPPEISIFWGFMWMGFRPLYFVFWALNFLHCFLYLVSWTNIVQWVIWYLQDSERNQHNLILARMRLAYMNGMDIIWYLEDPELFYVRFS